MPELARDYVHQNIGARRKVRPGPGRAARVAARNASSQRALEALLSHGPAAAAINEMGDVDVPAGWKRYGGHGAVLWPSGTKALATRTAPLSRAVTNKRNARSWGHARAAYCVTFPGAARPVTVIAGHLCPPRNRARDPRRQSIAANHAGQRNLAALIRHFRDAGHDVVCGADINVGWAKALPALRDALTWQAVHGIDWLGATAVGHAKKLPKSGSDHPGQLLTVPVGTSTPPPPRPPKETPVARVRKAASIELLFTEMNKRFPKRTKISDGWLGDAAHRSRDSDHNPWIVDPSGDRIVSAGDVTEDAEGGFSEIVDFMVRTIVTNRDERVKYLIHEGQIWRSYDKVVGGRLVKAWTPAPYDGPNAHEHHGHLSVKPEKRYYDSTRPWGLLTAELPHKKGERDLSYRDRRPVMVGADVRFVQEKVGANADGYYGPKTAAKVEVWERKHNADLARLEARTKPTRPAPRLKVDGTVGVRTWEALGVTPTYTAKTKPTPKR